MQVQKGAQVSRISFLKGVLFVKEQSNSIIKTVPAAEALRKVPQFNPRYLRQTTSLKTGEPVFEVRPAVQEDVVPFGVFRRADGSQSHADHGHHGHF